MNASGLICGSSSQRLKNIEVLLSDEQSFGIPSSTDLIETVFIGLNQGQNLIQGSIFDGIFSEYEQQENDISGGSTICHENGSPSQKSNFELDSLKDEKSKIIQEDTSFRTQEFKSLPCLKQFSLTFNLRVDVIDYFMADLRSAGLSASQMDSIISPASLFLDKEKKKEVIRIYKSKIQRRSKYKGKYRRRCQAAQRKLRIKGRFIKNQNAESLAENTDKSSVEHQELEV